jgi:hypothetical protein
MAAMDGLSEARPGITAKPEQMYPESTPAKWIFPQEKCTWKTLSKGA